MTSTCPALAAQLTVLLSGTHHERGSAAAVAAQAAALAELVARRGGQVLADGPPSGGRHVFVLFAAALPWRELRDLCPGDRPPVPRGRPGADGHSRRPDRPPGSRHKRGGWRMLTTPLSEARAAVEHPNGPVVWAALLTEFAAELQQVEQRARAAVASRSAMPS